MSLSHDIYIHAVIHRNIFLSSNFQNDTELFLSSTFQTSDSIASSDVRKLQHMVHSQITMSGTILEDVKLMAMTIKQMAERMDTFERTVAERMDTLIQQGW